MVNLIVSFCFLMIYIWKNIFWPRLDPARAVFSSARLDFKSFYIAIISIFISKSLILKNLKVAFLWRVFDVELKER